MPLYTTATAKSVDVPVAEHLADRLSETAAFQELCGAATAAEALESTLVGEGLLPWDGDAFTDIELQQQHCWATIFDPNDGGQEQTFLGTGVDELNQVGVLTIEVYWKPKLTDLEEDRGDCYRFFWDRSAAIKNQLWAAAYASANQCPRIQSVEVLGRGWSKYAREKVEGGQLCCSYRVMWGDPGE